MKNKKESVIYIVMADDCNEGECDCHLESPDAAFYDKKDAEAAAKKVYRGRVISLKIS